MVLLKLRVRSSDSHCGRISDWICMYRDNPLYERKQPLEEQKLDGLCGDVNNEVKRGEVEGLSGNPEESNESWVDVVGSLRT